MTRSNYRRLLLAQVGAALVGAWAWWSAYWDLPKTVEGSLVFTLLFVVCTVWWCIAASQRLKTLHLPSGWAWATAPVPPFSFFLAIWLWFKTDPRYDDQI